MMQWIESKGSGIHMLDTTLLGTHPALPLALVHKCMGAYIVVVAPSTNIIHVMNAPRPSLFFIERHKKPTVGKAWERG